VYEKAIRQGSVVDTDNCSVAVSVKDAARIIHFGNYAPFNFAQRLRQLKKGKWMIDRPKLYLAAPLFSLAERTENDKLCRSLERWCDVFLPQRDGELVPHLIQRGVSKDDAYRVVFDRDVAAIRSCDALVINLDGRSVDEGASFELGLAYALGKLCVGYRTDVRVLLPWGLNPMIIAPLTNIFACVEELEQWAKMLSSGEAQLWPRLVRKTWKSENRPWIIVSPAGFYIHSAQSGIIDACPSKNRKLAILKIASAFHPWCPWSSASTARDGSVSSA
jgi:nucleoside 2-deoxyribosyltransferase